MGRKIVSLLFRFLSLLQRWGQWWGLFSFELVGVGVGVAWRGVCDLW
jgi:hypothetical protein